MDPTKKYKEDYSSELINNISRLKGLRNVKVNEIPSIIKDSIKTVDKFKELSGSEKKAVVVNMLEHLAIYVPKLVDNIDIYSEIIDQYVSLWKTRYNERTGIKKFLFCC